MLEGSGEHDKLAQGIEHKLSDRWGALRPDSIYVATIQCHRLCTPQVQGCHLHRPQWSCAWVSISLSLRTLLSLGALAAHLGVSYSWG